jgi:hypothetical protein
MGRRQFDIPARCKDVMAQSWLGHASKYILDGRYGFRDFVSPTMLMSFGVDVILMSGPEWKASNI